MPAVQTTYAERQPIAVAGMPATMHTTDADSAVVETVTGIPFARAVGQGTNDNSVVIATTLPLFRGVTYRDVTLIPTVSPSVNAYPQGSTAGIMTRGDIWVDVSEPVAKGDAVAYDATGRFGKTAGTLVPNARWVRGIGAIGGLALLRLNQP